MNPVRLEAVDVARGLAALSVAVYHHGVGRALAAATGCSAFGLLDWPGSTLAVPLFFVISGFCIHLGGLTRPAGAESPRRFFLLRLIRIYPAWIVAIGISALVRCLDGQPPDSRQLLAHLTLSNGFFNDYTLNAALWSVSVECCLYLLYPLWLGLRRRFGLSVAALVPLLVSGASCLLTARLFPEPSGTTLWFFLNVWCGWIAGALLAECWLSPLRSRLQRPLFWITGLCAAILQVILIGRGAYAGPWLYLHLPLTIILCCWPLAGVMLAGETFPASTFTFLHTAVWRPLAAIGLFSYSLYLLHIPLQSLRFILLAHLTAPAWVSRLLFFAWFGLVLALAWLSYRWIELPASRLGRRLLAAT